ncbi:DUF423 domain-containing protein [Planctomicrobium sp. SH664]|uniref:DUF423 domain-containing protein n=1 Tax=Planctomicrobium sp. SH664 TaxID=3448125 RepID=UPI003F5CB252
MLTADARCWIRCGAICGCLAVVLGALAAHGLQKPLMEKYQGQTKEFMGTTIPAAQKYLGDFQTGTEYQMSHALALVALGLLPPGTSRRARNVAGWCFLTGILLFSGSLYLLVLTGVTKLGMITPIGGTLLIVGWIALACATCCRTEVSPQG